MRLLLISPWGSKCGIAIYSEALCAALVRCDPSLDIEVLTERDVPPRGGAPDTASGITVTPHWRRGGITVTPHWRRGDDPLRGIDRSGIDVVHVEHEFGFWSEGVPVLDALRRAREAGVRTVVTCHSPIPAGFGHGDFFRPLTDLADAVIVLGARGRKHLIDWGFPPERAHYVPHGVFECTRYDRSKAWEIVRAAGIDVPDDLPIVLCFGFISSVKQIGDLVAASPAIRGRARVLIVGGIPEREVGAENYARAMIAAARTTGGTVQVHPRFVSDQIRDALHSVATAAVSTRKAESESGAVVTALRFGLPIIMRSGGASIFGPDDALTFVDVPSLAAALENAVTSPATRDLLSARSRTLAETFTWERAAKAHMEVYRG